MNTSYPTKLPFLLQRVQIIKEIRSFFDKQGFLEVDTPCLQVCPGMDVHQNAFETVLKRPFSRAKKKMFLHTSPEFGMKQVLALGFSKIYQLSHSFRNTEFSPLHQPEFLMLEFYRAGANYKTTMEDTVALVRSCAELNLQRKIVYNCVECDPFADWQYLSVAEAFQQFAGVDLLQCLADTNENEPNPEPIKKEAERLSIKCSKKDRFEDVFFRIMLEKIEPFLGTPVPTVLYDYPVCMAALSQKSATNPKLSERFEVYICGVELGNGYTELTDYRTHVARFKHAQKLQKKLYGTCYPMDGEFLQILKEERLPECTGIAIGVDRLIMLITGAGNIADTMWLPVR